MLKFFKEVKSIWDLTFIELIYYVFGCPFYIILAGICTFVSLSQAKYIDAIIGFLLLIVFARDIKQVIALYKE